MALYFRVPLAWKNLTHHWPRLMVKLGGVGFAVVLMCMQLGYLNALYDSTVALLEALDAQLLVASKAHYALSVREPFDGRRLQQARAVPEVVAADPLYIDTALGLWKNPDDGVARPIRVIALDPAAHVFNLPGMDALQRRLRRPGAVLFDRRSKRDSFGRAYPGLSTELAGRQVQVVGLCTLGTDFVNDGTVLVGLDTYRQLFYPSLPEEMALARADLGVVRLRPDADAAAVQQKLRGLLPGDVSVYTRDELIEVERSFWRQSTPIGAFFGVGTAVGFIVGVVICYQILFADISDHLAEFATLKAMGYTRRYFVGVVAQAALLLSLMGFVPGVAVSYVLYEALERVTGLPMALTLGRGGTVLLLTVAMCGVSGLLAMRKVLASDPAELFR